ncbi:Phosphoprotein phosphatase [Bertholletia excelsa]
MGRGKLPSADARRPVVLSESGVVYRYSMMKARSSRRRRLEIRRLKSSSRTKAGFGRVSLSDSDRFSGIREVRKKELSSELSRSQDRLQNRASELSLSYSPAPDLSPEIDVITSRTSTVRYEEIEIRGKSISEDCSENRACELQLSQSPLPDRSPENRVISSRTSNVRHETLEKYDFFGVYDGHGGSLVANACRDRLHWLLLREIEEEDAVVGPAKAVDWEKVMVACFAKMDEEVNESKGAGADSTALSTTIGSTAMVAVVGEEELVVANCGDSRAVLSRGGVAISMSNDHKPDRPDELERIEGAGGRVINWNGYRVLGVLATSRSIGDHYLKPFVIPKPEVNVSKRDSPDEFLILATDGLWDVISNEVACEVVRRCLEGRMKRRSPTTVKENKVTEIVNESRAAKAAAVLTELAVARGSRDNVSVVVVELNKTSKCTM